MIIIGLQMPLPLSCYPGFNHLVLLEIIFLLVVDWFAPNGWTGPDPILYWSLDTLEDMILMEGTQASKFAPLVSGKVILPKCKISQSIQNRFTCFLGY